MRGDVAGAQEDVADEGVRWILLRKIVLIIGPDPGRQRTRAGDELLEVRRIDVVVRHRARLAVRNDVVLGVGNRHRFGGHLDLMRHRSHIPVRNPAAAPVKIVVVAVVFAEVAHQLGIDAGGVFERGAEHHDLGVDRHSGNRFLYLFRQQPMPVGKGLAGKGVEFVLRRRIVPGYRIEHRTAVGEPGSGDLVEFGNGAVFLLHILFELLPGERIVRAAGGIDRLVGKADAVNRTEIRALLQLPEQRGDILPDHLPRLGLIDLVFEETGGRRQLRILLQQPVGMIMR